MKSSKKAFHEQVADSLIKQLKQGTAPWQKPWKPGDPLLTLPNNPSTGKRYRGINTVNLMSKGHSDPRWMTYKQASGLGAQVKKGEKSTQVQYWKFTEERTKKDNNGNPVLNGDGTQIKEQIKLERPRAFYASVFNAEQIDNLPELVIKVPDWEPIERAEQILKASNAVIHHGQNDKAFYRSSSDEIHLPHKEQFATPENYYATALHELGHWTGHESRLSRDLNNPFGSEAYAKEELRAEIASMIMGSELGIGHDPEQHAAYVGSWIKVLQEDPKEIFRAAADAEKIQDYILSLSQTQKIVQEQDMENKQIDEVEQSVPEQKTNEKESVVTRQYLVVPYQEKDQAKASGASWDSKAKSWFVGENADTQALQRWMPENVSSQQAPPMEPRVEFTELLRANGCIVDGNHPVMDGTKQRIKVEGDKPAEKSGFYVGHLDDKPAGYFKNNRSGVETRWKAKGYTLNDGQKAELSAQAAVNQQNRKAAQHEQQLKVAHTIKQLLAIAPSANAEHPYLLEKNARAGGLKIVPGNADELPKDSIIKIGKDWQESKALRESNPDSIVLTAGDLLLPAQDIDGETWSVQTIQPSGAKFFAAGSKKESNFYVVDGENRGLASLDAAPAIVIAEGYATADTLSKALDNPVVTAFDSGNLPKVALALHEKYPQKPIIIAGDDDRSQEAVNGKNPGREKAMEAAELVNGVTVFATFAPNEQVTQKLSDFNDLANKSTLGFEAVKRQVGFVVAKVSEQSKVEKLERRVEQNQQEKQQKRVLVR